MVYRTMEPNILPLPPPSMGRQGSKGSQHSTPSKGFRLVDDQVETGSVYSIYKQKIDAMFESDSSGQVSNTVQARIERMFTEVAKDEGIKSDVGCHSFSIDYLGSIPLVQKVTSLSGLQVPLKELYFAYKRNTRHKSTLTGRLEISHVGLKVQYQGDKGDLEQLNPFPTIAVWSAVKFVLHDEPKKSYAFLPLITDPDNIDKQSLFKNLEENESKYIVNQTHAPLFAVVMRKIGLHKQLECHGFVCQTSEDAIVIAATLYKSLMSHMKSKDKKPRNRNGVSCMSVTSSICADSIQNATPVRPPRKKRSTASSIISETDTTKGIDTNKQVRKSTKTRRAPTVPLPKNQGDMDEILPYEEPNGETKNEAKKEWKEKNGQQGEESELVRSRSLRKLNEEGIMTKNGENSGDILTKVTIPRSGSFLNAGGLTRYKSKVNRYNGQASGGSPLGFNELFNEFRLQEGLHSMDEILGVIIDSEGMSFNDLKPIYKEFLLKLAVTLTKDELYQRSKAIMRRQKKKILRKNSNAQKNRRNIIVGAKGLKRVFRKSFRLNLSKRIYKKKQKNKVFELKKTPMSEKKQVPESSISTSSYDTRQFRPKQSNVVRKQSYRKRNSDIKEANMRIRRERMSTSEDSDFFTMKRSKSKTSPNNQNRNSSSGYGLGCPLLHTHNLQHCKIDYVSCSECSYDSDTCTCVSADKCYCSLGNKFDRNHNRNHMHNQKPPKPRPHTSSSCRTDERCYCTIDSKSFSWCGCDTDSCTDSNKCYCQHFTPKGTIFEQLQRRGFIPTSEDMITPPNERKLCQKNSNTRSTKSVEYLHNPTEKYYEKIGQRNSMSHEFLTSRPGSRRSYSSDNLSRECEVTSISGKRMNPVYTRAMSEVATRNFPLQNSVRSFKSFNENNRKMNGKTMQTTTVPANSSTEALSVKKSAEIAALFTDIKLSQTTDITHLLPRDYSDVGGQNTNYCKQLHNVKPIPKTDKKAIVAPYKHVSNLKLSQNSLYAARNQSNGKNGLYSARNGLYTIQSQSDSSCSENKNDKTYFNMKQDNGMLKKSVNNSLENTLGYLP